MKFALLAAVAAMTVTGFAALPAIADDDDMSPARLQRLDDKAKARGVTISRDQAIAIARQNGMTDVREIDLDDNDEWELEGRQANGREIEIEISAKDGRIKEIERD
jgi:uncharacterized membrane protein YkoI